MFSEDSDCDMYIWISGYEVNTEHILYKNP